MLKMPGSLINLQESQRLLDPKSSFESSAGETAVKLKRRAKLYRPFRVVPSQQKVDSQYHCQHYL